MDRNPVVDAGPENAEPLAAVPALPLDGAPPAADPGGVIAAGLDIPEEDLRAAPEVPEMFRRREPRDGSPERPGSPILRAVLHRPERRGMIAGHDHPAEDRGVIAPADPAQPRRDRPRDDSPERSRSPLLRVLLNPPMRGMIAGHDHPAEDRGVPAPADPVPPRRVEQRDASPERPPSPILFARLLGPRDRRG